MIYWVLILAMTTFVSAAKTRTALELDNHPCQAENLKRTNRYICDHHGKVICQPGWKEPESKDPLHQLHPCLEPVCESCVNGECISPGFCACEVGWEGQACDRCIPLPGCVHGSCNNSFECICEPGWSGKYCNIADCGGICQNGDCVGPNLCVCWDGWNGVNCTECEPMAGCQHGICVDYPHTCKCLPGWEGLLCDRPVCDNICIHGFCHANINPDGSADTFCICHSGWRGAACDKCSPYWECPNQGEDACNQPNECLCKGTEPDPEKLCNNTLLKNGGRRGRGKGKIARFLGQN